MDKIIISGTSQFYYTTRPVAVTNPLGFVRTVLEEYEVTSDSGENYRLYRTLAGNWFDMEEAGSAAAIALMSTLKRAIARIEKSRYW